MSSQYDVDAVQSRISNDIEAARLVYAEEILDWTDAYSERYGEGVSNVDGGEQEQLRKMRAIGKLWIRYAGMEQQLKQWKKVVQVFEDALVDPVGRSNLEVHLAYTSFCRGRGKINNAQKVFVRALAQDCPLHSAPFHPVQVVLSGDNLGQSTEVLTVAAAELLWTQFLLMKRGDDSPDIKIEQLYNMLSPLMSGPSAVVKPMSFSVVEKIAQLVSAEEKGTPPPSQSTFDRLIEAFVLGQSDTMPKYNEKSSAEATNVPSRDGEALVDGESPLKRSRLEAPQDFKDSTTTTEQYGRLSNNAATPYNDLTNFQDLSKLCPTGSKDEQLASLLAKYQDRPTLLFSASHKEPLRSGFGNLDKELIEEVENYFKTSGVSRGHTSADELDRDMRAACRHPNSSLTNILAILEGLWISQALQEGHFDKWFNTLISSHRSEQEALQRQHYQEESKLRASNGSETNLFILRIKHEHALRSLRALASLQTDLLNANINRTLCLMRHEQERVLQFLEFPFTKSIDSLKMYEFFNERKSKGKGEKGDISQDDDSSSSVKFNLMHDNLIKQRNILGALLSLCPSFSDGREAPVSTEVTPPAIVRSSSSFSVNSATSDTVISSPRSPDVSSASPKIDDMRSSSGKKKRRRKLVNAQEQLDVLRQRSSSAGGYNSSWGSNGQYDPFKTLVEVGHEKAGSPKDSALYAPPIMDHSQPSIIHHRNESEASVRNLSDQIFPVHDVVDHAQPSGLNQSNAEISSPPDIAASANKSNNLAKIAALLASKKANKK